MNHESRCLNFAPVKEVVTRPSGARVNSTYKWQDSFSNSKVSFIAESFSVWLWHFMLPFFSTSLVGSLASSLDPSLFRLFLRRWQRLQLSRLLSPLKVTAGCKQEHEGRMVLPSPRLAPDTWAFVEFMSKNVQGIVGCNHALWSVFGFLIYCLIWHHKCL